MNFGLAKEIYGLQPWCMDQYSIPSYTSLLRDFQNGVTLELPDIKGNSPFVVQSRDNKVITHPYQLDNEDDFEGVGLIRLNGPITKNGGMSSYGMVQLASIMQAMSKDERIKSFIIAADSGGGSSAAVDIMADTILEIKEGKSVLGWIEKGGMAASACFGIISACHTIHAVDKMSLVGSVGTMIAFNGKAANSVDPDGTKNIRLYATKSIRKNKDFEEALNNDNYEVIINDLLDPINEDFIKKTLKNRPQLKGSNFDDGHHVFAKDAVGTFIDGFKTFDQVLTLAYKGNKSPDGAKSNNVKSKSNTMTVEELRQSHPETYNSILNAGVSAEKDRTGAWLAHVATNQETVIAGIKSGGVITMTQTQELLVEASSKQQLKNLEGDSAGAVVTKETKLETKEGEAENAELTAFLSQADAKRKKA